MMTGSQKAAALHATVALGSLEALLHLEKPKSARYNRLAGAIDAVNRVVDLYRLSSFPYEDMSFAGELIDLVNEQIKNHYGVDLP